MTDNLMISKMGKLRIYITAGEKIRSEKLLHKVFPKSKYLKILQEAKTSGIINAHVFKTHASMQNGGNITHNLVDGNTSALVFCIELIDERIKLETFFSTHKNILQKNIVEYKEVEFWKYENV